VYYQHFFPLHMWALSRTPVPPADKYDAIAYIQGNCGQHINGTLERQALMQEIMDMGQIEVHSYGSCMNNMANRTDLPAIEMLPDFGGDQPPTHDEYLKKLSIFRHYKFCMAGENNRYQDYVTEKVGSHLLQMCEMGCV
jgi:hypothetical protein